MSTPSTNAFTVQEIVELKREGVITRKDARLLLGIEHTVINGEQEAAILAAMGTNNSSPLFLSGKETTTGETFAEEKVVWDDLKLSPAHAALKYKATPAATNGDIVINVAADSKPSDIAKAIELQKFIRSNI